MAKQAIITTAVVGMAAGDKLFIHPNIETHDLPMPLALAIWVAWGMASGYCGDRVYNRHVKSLGFAGRLALLVAIYAVISISILIAAKILFWIF